MGGGQKPMVDAGSLHCVHFIFGTNKLTDELTLAHEE